MNILIRAMTGQDWPRVRQIYQEGIASGNATFETEVPDWQQWDTRHVTSCRLIATMGGEVVGWAALSPVSVRRVYAGVGEVSVYVAGAARGQGVGRVLLSALIAESEKHGFWTLQAGIFPENASSIGLHRALGFREVGIRERLGRVRGHWRDVVLMERRSQVIGV